jgi:ribosomal protein S27E
MGEDSDPPLIVRDDMTPFGAQVIDLANVRIQFGVPDPKRGRPCDHLNLLYSTAERRVWCEDCTRTIDNFDAFMVFTKYFREMEAAARAKMAVAKQAEAATINRRAAKVIDSAWSGHQMAVCCPRCGGGLLPEDFAFGVSQVSAEIERARRKREKP